MSFDNANLPSVSELLAITTKNAMEKRVSEIDKSECLYPINKNIKSKYNKLINKKAINICEGRINYVSLRQYSYESRFNTKREDFYNKKYMVELSADAKEEIINWSNNGEHGIVSMRKKLEKTKYIVEKYEKYLNALFWWDSKINNKDTDKKKVNRYKKNFKKTVVSFLFVIEKWNAKHDNYKLKFLRPDITHGSGRMKIRRKIIEEFQLNLNCEKSSFELDCRRYANLCHIKKTVEKIENAFLNAKYNPRTKLGYKFVNDLYDENF